MYKKEKKISRIYYSETVGKIETKQEFIDCITNLCSLFFDLENKADELNTTYFETQNSIFYDTIEKSLGEIVRNCYDMQDKIAMLLKIEDLLNEDKSKKKTL